MVGIIVAVALVGAYLMMGGEDTASNPTPVQLVNNLVINDQNPDSVAVLVARASLDVPGYVVIHDNDNGNPGKIIGVSKLLTPDEYTNLSVIAPLKPGNVYFGMLHADDGNGLYDVKTDVVHLQDASGKEIMPMFKVLLTDPNGEIKG